MYREVYLSISVINVVFLLLILYYLQELKTIQCKCAQIPAYHFLTTTIWVLLFLRFFLILKEWGTPQLRPLARGLAVFHLVLSLVFFGVSLYFIVKLKRISCDCSKSMLQWIYLFYSILKIIWIFSILIALGFIWVFIKA